MTKLSDAKLQAFVGGSDCTGDAYNYAGIAACTIVGLTTGGLLALGCSIFWYEFGKALDEECEKQ